MKNIILWLRRFVMIYGIIMICTFFMCLLFNPISQLPVVAFFGRIIVFTLLGMATMVVYYSKDELTRGAWLGRTILHLFDEAVAGTGTRPRCPSPWDTGSGPCPKAYSFTRMLPL